MLTAQSVLECGDLSPLSAGDLSPSNSRRRSFTTTPVLTSAARRTAAILAAYDCRLHTTPPDSSTADLSTMKAEETSARRYRSVTA